MPSRSVLTGPRRCVRGWCLEVCKSPLAKCTHVEWHCPLSLSRRPGLKCCSSALFDLGAGCVGSNASTLVSPNAPGLTFLAFSGLGVQFCGGRKHSTRCTWRAVAAAGAVAGAAAAAAIAGRGGGHLSCQRIHAVSIILSAISCATIRRHKPQHRRAPSSHRANFVCTSSRMKTRVACINLEQNK